MIISASRRTDIPAFYSAWLMNRVREGFLLTRNPFNSNQVKRVSLLAEDVDLFVFWTRNPKNLMKYIHELDIIGHKYYFQYTITGYHKMLETKVPRPHSAIETFCSLSDMIGPEKLVWRYDPILLSNIVDLSEHKRLFEKIASSLSGMTKKVVISFSDLYKNTERNLKKVEGLIYTDITKDVDMLYNLVSFMSQVAKNYGMVIETCAEEFDLSKFGVEHGKCIDDKFIKNIFNLSLSSSKDSGQRDTCGCIRSVDIGMYNTCLHGCSYCYATFNQGLVLKNKEKHDPDSPFLIGGIEGVETRLLNAPMIQESLF